MSALIEMPGKGIARRSSKGDVARVVIRETLAEFLPLLATARHYGHRWDKVWLGDGPVESVGQHVLATAKGVLAEWLRHYVDIGRTRVALSAILDMPDPIEEGSAMQMVSRLFAALGKRKSDPENAKMLSASVDMLSPFNQEMGSASGLWKPINAHRLIVALAVEKIIANEKFTSVAELREAMVEAERAVWFRARDMEWIVEGIERADAIVFLGDRPAWDAAYATVSGDVALAMQERTCIGEGPEDEDGDAIAPSPRWAALNEIVEAKKLAAPGPKPKRLAAASKRGEAKRSSRAR
jgi:hypothetical protein